MFYFRKTAHGRPDVAFRPWYTDYSLFDSESGRLIAFVREIHGIDPKWILVDDGVSSEHRVLDKLDVANASDLTQRLYMMAVLGMFSVQRGTSTNTPRTYP